MDRLRNRRRAGDRDGHRDRSQRGQTEEEPEKPAVGKHLHDVAVRVLDVEHVLIVPAMTAIAAGDLREARGQLTRHRDAIVAALDYLFLGV